MTPSSEASSSKLNFITFWAAYGGWKTMAKSGYLWSSFVLTLFLWKFWTVPKWWEVSLAILPSTAGFTLGGYAILLAFGDDAFRKLLARAKTSTGNALLEMSSAFAMFIFIQVVGLVLAITSKAWHPDETAPSKLELVLWFFGAWLLFYALALLVAATLRIYDVSALYALALQLETPPVSSVQAPVDSKDQKPT